MIRFQQLSTEEAKRILTEYDHYDDIVFQDLVNNWKQFNVTNEYHPSYEEFRMALIEAFKEALVKTGGKMNYLLDLYMGIKLYQLLRLGKDFSAIQSSDDGIWRYISVKVMPDITYLRYPDPEKSVRDEGGRMNHKRFYAATRRIWLKSLWWYIHLSWQGSEEKTFEVETHGWENGHVLEWIPTTVELSGVTIDENTTITITHTDDEWTASTANRWFLDNIRISAE